MRTNLRGARAVAIVALLALPLTAACGDDPTGPENPGRLAIRLTDAPLQEISQVNVYIDGLRIKQAGEPERRFAADVGSVDLLQLQDSSMLLAESAVEAGEYEYIVVELDQERSNLLVGGAQRVDVRIPSETIKVFGPFQVAANALTVVTLDFDVGLSLQQLGNGDWLMTPIIILLSVQIS